MPSPTSNFGVRLSVIGEDAPSTLRDTARISDSDYHENIAAPPRFDSRITWKQILDHVHVSDSSPSGLSGADALLSSLATRYYLQSAGQFFMRLSSRQLMYCQMRRSPTDLTSLRETALQLYALGAVTEECGGVGCESLNGQCADSRIAAQVFPAVGIYRAAGEKEMPDRYEQRLKIVIFRWGSIVSAIPVYQSLLDHRADDGVYDPVPTGGEGGEGGDRLVSRPGEGVGIHVVGWTERGWICALPWGKDWCDGGYVEIAFGNKTLGLEHQHLVVIPELPSATTSYSIFDPIVDAKDRAARRINGVSPYTYLPSATAADVLNGHLLTGPDISVDQQLLPVVSTYAAGLWGVRTFPTLGDEKEVGPVLSDASVQLAMGETRQQTLAGVARDLGVNLAALVARPSLPPSKTLRNLGIVLIACSVALLVTVAIVHARKSPRASHYSR